MWNPKLVLDLIYYHVSLRFASTGSVPGWLLQNSPPTEIWRASLTVITALIGWIAGARDCQAKQQVTLIGERTRMPFSTSFGNQNKTNLGQNLIISDVLCDVTTRTISVEPSVPVMWMGFDQIELPALKSIGFIFFDNAPKNFRLYKSWMLLWECLGEITQRHTILSLKEHELHTHYQGWTAYWQGICLIGLK